ncbi:MAG TPA: hypothetical protein VE961_21230 [Pyrinomonadaceae bacterium]|nr:hypothetical protein [Pyrinomonadaceae bacterium]
MATVIGDLPKRNGDVELKTIDLRLDAIKDATQRSRYVFVVMTIMTATILISLWNAMLSWDRGVAFEPRPSQTAQANQPQPPGPEAAAPAPSDVNARAMLVAENQRTVTSEWLKNLVVSVGLLGIRVSTNDLAVVGSLSLIVIMVWFFFSQRRENRAIVGLLRDCSDKYKTGTLSKELCWMVYEAVVQNIVFLDMGGDDKPLTGLRDQQGNSERNQIVRFILTGMGYLPPLTILMILISDIASLLVPSYLRAHDGLLLGILINDRQYGLIIKILGFEAFAVFAFIYTLRLCIRCRKFGNATGVTIFNFYQLITNSDPTATASGAISEAAGRDS